MRVYVGHLKSGHLKNAKRVWLSIKCSYNTKLLWCLCVVADIKQITTYDASAQKLCSYIATLSKSVCLRAKNIFV